ncbi:MAG: TlpA disulfide reductase family protein [Rikenellaceae bacterium]
MKKLFYISLILSLSFNICKAQTIPLANIENANGETIKTTSIVDGKPFILSFWSTTCKPCIMELNSINENLEDWQKEADFNVIAISIDDSRSLAKAKAMANGFGWEFTVLYDKNQDFKRAMNVANVPQIFVCDSTGKIIYSHSGYTPGGEYDLFEKIKALK